MAARFIYAASGYQYGLCEQIVRPCGDDCNTYTTYWGPSNASAFTPMLRADGQYINCIGGGCGCDPCECCHFCAVRLDGPVASVTEVKVDGVVIDPAEYFIVDEVKLVKRIGCFPTCQNIQGTAAELDTFQVKYMLGRPLDEAGQAALDTLACEFLKACVGGACRLPSRWRSISREGISIEQIDNFDTLAKGRIGIFEIDSWLAVVNPSGNMYPNYIPKMDGRTKLVRQTWP